MRILGMMSGTSHDGIDMAIGDFAIDGDRVVLTPIVHADAQYDDALQDLLRRTLPPNATSAHDICELDTRIGQAFADAAVAVLADHDVDLIVSHGQTVYHWVEGGHAVRGSLQLGQPAWIAERTGRPILADVRARDIAAGGQGAPLVSLFDVMLLADPHRATAALNLGGIANVTIMSPVSAPLAFDTGPANALMDAAVHHLTDGAQAYDAGGALARAGRVDVRLLAELLAEPYYALSAPKTTGKELFHWDYLSAALDRVGGVADADLVRTLAELTARTVADAVASAGIEELVAAGGGTANPTLMETLDQALGATRLTTIDERGLASASKEAHAFALLGFLSLHGLPGVVASCTGAERAASLGALLPGLEGFPRPESVDQPPTRLVIVR